LNITTAATVAAAPALVGPARQMAAAVSAGRSLLAPHKTVAVPTLEQYCRRGELLLSRYRRERRVSEWEEVCPLEFVNWFLSTKPRLKPSSWRFYRSSLYYFVAGMPGYRALRALDALEADAATMAARNDPPQRSAQTSSLKAKYIPNLHYEKMLAYLRETSRSQYAAPTEKWLCAGLLTALRPSEWRATEVVHVGEATVLRVMNAKATNGRGTGAMRSLDISGFSEQNKKIVIGMAEAGREWEKEGVFSHMQEQCGGFLYDVNRRLWPRKKYHYTLYSVRHQAIANFKSILPAVDIAALVGHIVTSTAATHYGRRRNAWAPGEIPVPPRPLPGEVALVRDQARKFFPEPGRSGV